MPNPYAPAQIDFSMLANLPQLYQQGQQWHRENALRNQFAANPPTDLATMTKMLFAGGDIDNGVRLAQALANQQAEQAYRQASLGLEADRSLPESYRQWWAATHPNQPLPSQGAAIPSQGAVGPPMDIPGPPVPGASVVTKDPRGALYPQQPQLAQKPDVTVPTQSPGGYGEFLQQTQNTPQKQEDIAFAKDLNTWETTGRAETEQNLKSLKAGIDELKGPAKVSGNVPGVLGLIGRNVPGYGAATMGELIKKYPGYAAANYPEAIDVMNRHVRAVAVGMKNILGARPAESVINQVIAATYNADLPPPKNVERLESLYKNIQDAAKAKDARAKWFREHGTLAGYSGPSPESIIENGVNEYTEKSSSSSSSSGGGVVDWKSYFGGQ